MLNWKCGFEIELLAPVGKSRKDIAKLYAKRHGGKVERIFYPQSEPSAVDGMDVFHNLVLGFKVSDRDGNTLLTCVDDLTISGDLERSKPSKKGWYRIVSDDLRLLRLAMGHCDPKADQRDVLGPLANLFATDVDVSQKDMFKVEDETGQPIAIASTLPGERERPCELITPPLMHNQAEYLRGLMSIATELGFTVPKEAAVHVHYDAQKLQNTRVFCSLVKLLHQHNYGLRTLVGFNPNCTRLGGFPPELISLVSEAEFQNLSWKQAKEKLKAFELTKYCDFNLSNLINQTQDKHTFEVRIFAGSMDADVMTKQAVLFQEILEFCISDASVNSPITDMGSLIDCLALSSADKQYWKSQVG